MGHAAAHSQPFRLNRWPTAPASKKKWLKAGQLNSRLLGELTSSAHSTADNRDDKDDDKDDTAGGNIGMRDPHPRSGAGPSRPEKRSALLPPCLSLCSVNPACGKRVWRESPGAIGESPHCPAKARSFSLKELGAAQTAAGSASPHEQPVSQANSLPFLASFPYLVAWTVKARSC